MSFHRDYNQAFNAAVHLARSLKRETGLEKVNSPIDGKGFVVHSLPKPENRYGFELRCQIVRPDEPLMPENT